MGLGRDLTSLEHTVLGVLLKLQPCRAHAVVMEFASSQNLAFRSKAGSIYPLMTRLTQAGLLHNEGRKYRLAPAGVEELTRWVRPPFTADQVSTNLDLLRSRMYFLETLDEAERLAFLDYAEAELVGLLERVEHLVGEHVEIGDYFGELATMGAVKETEARIAWIRAVRERLVAGRPG
ncbi:MAG: PadR family transcriptional regulator [Fimbriimonadaceae bacterium]|nr:PadR family transcriptional regulator [Fimbriimonadaceae bacterium]